MVLGRPRKPLEAKILAGTFRADRDGPEGATPPATGAPTKPAWLTGEAEALWNQVVPGMGYVGERDSAALLAMCEQWGLYRATMWMMTHTAAGGPRKRPLTGKELRLLQIVADNALKHFENLAGRFGLTAADRARLRLPVEKKVGIPTRKRG